jgi:DNA (cytosine-5)-methyltransferase 1
MIKLGSLFDGIGGFPHSAQRHGITPVWASEIDPYCVSITKRHFPDMQHLGDICQINGADIEPVDIITFGSPCQDLSIAGKQAGLQGERSGLFWEAIRIIDEMREATNGKYPRWAVWENVPGVLSSNDRLDFRAVLQAFTKIDIPMPYTGRWAGAGMVRGGKCDVAWRILDAQYWGVPQRRRRVFVVADFAGERTGTVLFKPESLRGNATPGRSAGEKPAGHAGGGFAANMWPEAAQGENIIVRMREGQNGCGGRGPLISKDKSLTLATGNDQVVFAYDARGHGDGKTINTITRNNGDRITDYTPLCIAHGQGNAEICDNISPTLNCTHWQPYIADGGYIVRRLTPVECERLMGFPDDWTACGHDGKAISDTRRYRAIGNSVAVPCVEYIMAGIAEMEV